MLLGILQYTPKDLHRPEIQCERSQTVPNAKRRATDYHGRRHTTYELSQLPGGLVVIDYLLASLRRRDAEDRPEALESSLGRDVRQKCQRGETALRQHRKVALTYWHGAGTVLLL